MTEAEAKRALSELRSVDREIWELRQTRHAIRAGLTSVGGSGPVGGSRDPDRLGRTWARIDELDRRIEERCVYLAGLRAWAVGVIERLPDSRQRSVLRRRYILGQRWERIARELHYDVRQIYRLHAQGIRGFAASCQ